MAVARFSVSIEKNLLQTLDEYVANNQLSNRSQAIRQLISETKVKRNWEENQLVAGNITLVYDHHKNDLLHKINHIQHHFLDIILAAQHFHLDHHNCMEIVACKGKASDLKNLADQLRGLKGIEHSELSITIAH